MKIDTSYAQSLTDMAEFLQYLVSVYGLDLYKNKQMLTNLIADLYTGEERLKRLYRKAIIEDNLPLRVFELIDKTIEERKAILDAIAYQFAENNFYSNEIGKKVLSVFAKGISLQLSLIMQYDGTWLDEYGGKYSKDKKTLLFVNPDVTTYIILKGTRVISSDIFPDDDDGTIDVISRLVPSLINIIIPNSVINIDNGAFFDCSHLSNVVIPKSVTSVNDFTFSGCTSLTNIIIPNSVVSIGEEAFWGCTSLTNIIIPNSVVSIGERAFSGCTSLTNIVIPNSVVSIGEEAFSGCTSLTNIIISNSVVSIGEEAFSECYKLSQIKVDTQNKHFKSIENVLYTADLKILIRCSFDKKTFAILKGVTNIDDYSFSECHFLTNITIPSSVTNIGDFAFWNCI